MLDEISFRNATAQDDKTIKQMIRRARLDITSLKWQNFRVAEHDGHIVGIGQVKRYPNANEIGSLVTLHEYRGLGIAGTLIHQLEKQVGFPLYLLCEAKMEAYYKRFGYQIISWFDAPTALKLKTSFAIPLRIFGIRVLIMRKLGD